jgi:hypothetical protein
MQDIVPPKCSVCQCDWAIPCNMCDSTKLLCLSHLKGHQIESHDPTIGALRESLSKVQATRAMGMCMTCGKKDSEIYLFGGLQPVENIMQGVAVLWLCLVCVEREVIDYDTNYKGIDSGAIRNVDQKFPVLFSPLVDWSIVALDNDRNYSYSLN